MWIPTGFNSLLLRLGRPARKRTSDAALQVKHLRGVGRVGRVGVLLALA